ncbi:MAG TPA: hypothetical protein DEB37_13050, partial [Lysinibacillus sp.]|nr:hypothetical protein [Lysinibacillus sp.]
HSNQPFGKSGFYFSFIRAVTIKIAPYFQREEVVSDNTPPERVVNTFTLFAFAKKKHFYGLE